MMRAKIRRDHEAQVIAKKVARMHAKGKEMERISCFICRRMAISAIITGRKVLLGRKPFDKAWAFAYMHLRRERRRRLWWLRLVFPGSSVGRASGC